MPLTLATAVNTIEQALLRMLTLGLRRRLPAAATVAALRAAVTQGASGSARRPDDLIYVTSLTTCFQWSLTSTTADNGTTVIKPTDVTGAGRWLIATSTNARLDGTPIHKVTTGYLDAIRLHEGQETPEEFIDLAFGQTPAVAIVYVGDEPEEVSQVPGALYRWRFDFEMWTSSKNYRTAGEGARGSDVSAEQVEDPGVNYLDGRVMALLSSAPATIDALDGVIVVHAGAGRVQWHDLAQRRFCRSRIFHVYAAVHNNANDTDLAAVSSVHLDQREGGPNADDFDRDNYLVSGIAPTIGGALVQAMSAGSAQVGGAAVSYAGAVVTLAAHSDTYRDLTSGGVLTLTPVGIGADAPTLAAGSLRIGVTTTDDATVIADRILCARSRPWQMDNTIPKP